MPRKLLAIASGISTAEMTRLSRDKCPSEKYGTIRIAFTAAKNIVTVPTRRIFSMRCGRTWIENGGMPADAMAEVKPAPAPQNTPLATLGRRGGGILPNQTL